MFVIRLFDNTRGAGSTRIGNGVGAGKLQKAARELLIVLRTAMSFDWLSMETKGDCRSLSGVLMARIIDALAAFSGAGRALRKSPDCARQQGKNDRKSRVYTE
uniref:Uncharacterized protein n=1 Tax=Candidatus Kentrum sp. FM TaxID=2126340 RepID=A0A450VRN2_9GAMM|nr:MAG: hypothetical protein BECKFM1743A_GA0114220_1002916 [Candidatus Kentron sp. FM]VFJ45978.1 MAG: hypothetical protein BECKFM1743C_GA0114222_1003216 [Candidatus Kentron sp. FM]VFK07427.1 MAG: hypothetical protein BECKFM1743B_GA0114221_1004016 [Candidatus Kentron sp. FM]